MTALGTARGLLRRLARFPERLAHPLRRRAALRRLDRGGRPGRVLFVCHGNICRSPYAAGRHLLGARERGRRAVEVASAGFLGPDRRSPPVAREVAAERGVDLEAHRSRLVTAELVAWADLAVVMEPGQRRRLVRGLGARPEEVLVLGELDPEPRRRRRIRDPIGGGPELFARVYARIDRCVEALLTAIGP